MRKTLVFAAGSAFFGVLLAAEMASAKEPSAPPSALPKAPQAPSSSVTTGPLPPSPAISPPDAATPLTPSAPSSTPSAPSPAPASVAPPANAVSAAPYPPPPPTGWAPAPSWQTPAAPAYSVYPAYPVYPAGALPPRAFRARESYWYGWQTLLLFTGSLAVGAIPTAAGVPEIGLPLGLGGYLLGGPIVHFTHGNLGKGFASLGLNIGVPFVFGIAGIGTICSGERCGGDFGGLGAAFGFMIGSAIGAISSVIIDVSALSYGERMVDYGAARPRHTPWASLVPSVDIRQDRAILSLAGMF